VLIVVVIVVMIVPVMVPIAICMPALLVRIPPSAEPVPAAFPLRPECHPALFGLMTPLSMFTDRLIQCGFRALNPVLALGTVVICVQPGDIRQHCPTQRRCHNGRRCKSLKVLKFQVLLLVRIRMRYLD
jgi:hypothetical protein